MNGFNHYRQIALDELEQVLAQIDDEVVDRLSEEIVAAGRVFAVGAGRSGLAVRAYAMRLSHLGFSVHVVGDVTAPPIKRGDLLLAVSGSGNTRGIVQIAQTAKSQGARLACITTNDRSTLAAMADCCVVLPASTPKAKEGDGPALVRSAQPLANLFEQSSWLFGDIHSAILRDRLGEDNTSMMARHANLE